MRKTILKLGILGIFLSISFYAIPPKADAQTSVEPPNDCTPSGCWKTITVRYGWPAMYCGTCTYIDDSMGVGTDTGLCYQCPGIG